MFGLFFWQSSPATQTFRVKPMVSVTACVRKTVVKRKVKADTGRGVEIQCHLYSLWRNIDSVLIQEVTYIQNWGWLLGLGVY